MFEALACDAKEASNNSKASFFDLLATVFDWIHLGPLRGTCTNLYTLRSVL